jgi:hypothetical protein
VTLPQHQRSTMPSAGLRHIAAFELPSCHDMCQFLDVLNGLLRRGFVSSLYTLRLNMRRTVKPLDPGAFVSALAALYAVAPTGRSFCARLRTATPEPHGLRGIINAVRAL